MQPLGRLFAAANSVENGAWRRVLRRKVTSEIEGRTGRETELRITGNRFFAEGPVFYSAASFDLPSAAGEVNSAMSGRLIAV